eukprot:TRINITY_DN8172_c0_g1_i3.p1 TRINITY_DN8172_c0_g1~~TRINITY_DN8172_c0_g1_i3.p1  ORF type:complete len:607 (+),score=188.13 TRINITY_DN8172_c0_g1_i3:139-1959(+)
MATKDKDYLKEMGIHQILDTLAKEIISQKPDNPQIFAIEWLRKREEEEEAKAATGGAAKPGKQKPAMISVPDTPQKVSATTLRDWIKGDAKCLVVDVRPWERAEGDSEKPKPPAGGRVKGSEFVPCDVVVQAAGTYAEKWQGNETIVFVSMQSPDLDLTAAMPVMQALADMGSSTQVFILGGGVLHWVRDYSSEDPSLIDEYDAATWAKVLAPEGGSQPAARVELSAQTIAVVKATAPAVKENAEKITDVFYKTMFKNNPEALAFFNEANQAKGLQPKALAAAVVAYALNIDNLGALAGAVEHIAHRHCALSVKPEHYPIVHKNILLAIAEVLGEAVTPEVGAAWSEAVLFLAQVLIDAEEALYKQLEARKGGWRGERPFTVAKKEQLCEDTVTLELKASDGGGGFEFSTGQYITLRVKDWAPRHYSLTSASGSDSLIVHVRKIPERGGDPPGVVSNYICDSLQVGDEVRVGQPAGERFKGEAAAGDKGVVLIAGGIGMTDTIAIKRSFDPAAIKAVFIVEKSPGRLAFASEMEELGDRVKVHYTSERGRPDLAAEAEALYKLAGPDASYFMCAPERMMVGMADELGKLDVPKGNLHYHLYSTGML